MASVGSSTTAPSQAGGNEVGYCGLMFVACDDYVADTDKARLRKPSKGEVICSQTVAEMSVGGVPYIH
ncbi:hypothetical protein RRF57_010951 [Xylaria bambusicola]|uniref:Uncharacterized protein n=1 Tax=Xylaria bambusicola TaxID=326684 RepID=A0AAN7V435_9PEZI